MMSRSCFHERFRPRRTRLFAFVPKCKRHWPFALIMVGLCLSLSLSLRCSWTHHLPTVVYPAQPADCACQLGGETQSIGWSAVSRLPCRGRLLLRIPPSTASRGYPKASYIKRLLASGELVGSGSSGFDLRQDAGSFRFFSLARTVFQARARLSSCN